MSDIMKNYTCCFTGHRPEKLISGMKDIKETEKIIKNLLRSEIKNVLTEGYKTFITGMARGFDMWAADVVIEEKEISPEIKLICALPIPDFEKRWSADEQQHFKSILEKADLIKTISASYFPACFQVRNAFMVDYSSKIIAAYNGADGGTKNTIKYAKSKNLLVTNILDNLSDS